MVDAVAMFQCHKPKDNNFEQKREWENATLEFNLKMGSSLDMVVFRNKYELRKIFYYFL